MLRRTIYGIRVQQQEAEHMLGWPEGVNFTVSSYTEPLIGDNEREEFWLHTVTLRAHWDPLTRNEDQTSGPRGQLGSASDSAPFLASFIAPRPEKGSRSLQRQLAHRAEKEGRRTQKESPLHSMWTSVRSPLAAKVSPTPPRTIRPSQGIRDKKGGVTAGRRLVSSSEEKLEDTAGGRDFELPSGLSAIFAASSDFVDSINTPGLASVGEKRDQRSHPEQGEGACEGGDAVMGGSDGEN